MRAVQAACRCARALYGSKDAVVSVVGAHLGAVRGVRGVGLTRRGGADEDGSVVTSSDAASIVRSLTIENPMGISVVRAAGALSTQCGTVRAAGRGGRARG